MGHPEKRAVGLEQDSGAAALQNGPSGRLRPRHPARPPAPGSWLRGAPWRSSRCHFSWVAGGGRLVEEGEGGGEDFLPGALDSRPGPLSQAGDAGPRGQPGLWALGVRS